MTPRAVLTKGSVPVIGNSRGYPLRIDDKGDRQVSRSTYSSSQNLLISKEFANRSPTCIPVPMQPPGCNEPIDGLLRTGWFGKARFDNAVIRTRQKQNSFRGKAHVTMAEAKERRLLKKVVHKCSASVDNLPAEVPRLG